jgi:hypothetical protein
MTTGVVDKLTALVLVLEAALFMVYAYVLWAIADLFQSDDDSHATTSERLVEAGPFAVLAVFCLLAAPILLTHDGEASILVWLFRKTCLVIAFLANLGLIFIATRFTPESIAAGIYAITLTAAAALTSVVCLLRALSGPPRKQPN